MDDFVIQQRYNDSLFDDYACLIRCTTVGPVSDLMTAPTRHIDRDGKAHWANVD